MLKMNAVKKYGPKLAVVGGSLAALPSFATATDYSGITGAVDFATVATGIVAVFALLAVALVAYKGGKLLLRAI
jgi:hypothetical protein